MIASKYRISKRFFPQVMKGASFSGIYFKAIVSNPISNHQNFGVIISKKHLKKAVDRNYTKRVLYQFFQQNVEFFPNKAIVCLMIKKIPENLTIFQEITKDIEIITKNIRKKYENTK